MREQLVNYVELLFAGAPNSNEVKQEILQNTLDRYDDLLVQGKSPEAAYRQAISGIGDISEILDKELSQEDTYTQTEDIYTQEENTYTWQEDLSDEPVQQYASHEIPVTGKKKRSAVSVILIVVGIILGLSLLTICVSTILYSVGINEYSGEITILDGTTASVGSVSAAEVSQIEIQWAAGSITIVPGDTDTIDFSEEIGLATEDQLIWKQSGNKLQIQFCAPTDHWVGIGFNTVLSKDLVITVPRDWFCENLAINAASAEVRVQDLNINKVDFDGASGRCNLENCWIGDIDLDTASGDILLSGGVMNVDCDAASASCTLILKNTPKSIEMDTASGDLDITFPEECGFTVRLDGISTRFNSDFPTTNKNGMYVYGDGSCRIEVDTVSGNVTIRQEQ